MKKHIVRFSLLILTYICFSSPVFGLDLKSEDGNYAVAIPGTWTLTFQNQAGFSITSSNGSRTMTLLIAKARSGKLDSRLIAEIEQGLQRAGAQKISSKMFTIDGVPAYEIVQRIGKPPYATVMVDRQIIADGKFYGFHASVMGGDAAADSEMQDGLASFHFLHPPKPPGSFGFGSLGVKIAILGVIIVGVFLVVRSRRA
jgi:hypothetical protein